MGENSFFEMACCNVVEIWVSSSAFSVEKEHGGRALRQEGKMPKMPLAEVGGRALPPTIPHSYQSVPILYNFTRKSKALDG